MVSHRARFVSCWTTAIEHEVSPRDIVGLLTPFYHAMGSVVWMPTIMMMGATSVIQTGWEADAFINGGAVTPPDLVHEVAAKLPVVRFVNHYGQSETGPVCTLRPDDPRDKAATIGRPAIGVELRLVDGAGDDVPQGEPGEIIVRGPFLMDGYFENPEETGLYFRGEDGWGWTGDLATADEDGFLTLVGRSKDMIISGGVNIYPREIEIALEKHQAVRDCTVFGIPDEKWGEALCAYVVVDGAITEETIIAHCTKHLARFKRPKIVRFVEQIPKTPSGKIQKPVLRAAFLAENGLQ
jgi:acyl-CoA synthetase (AMP-forming)/AMP-acid ligase II